MKYCSELKEHIIAMTAIKEETAKYFHNSQSRQKSLRAMVEYDPVVKEAYQELEELLEKFIG